MFLFRNILQSCFKTFLSKLDLGEKTYITIQWTKLKRKFVRQYISLE